MTGTCPTGTAPTMTGGTIADGTYTLTSAQGYFTGCTDGNPDALTVVITGGNTANTISTTTGSAPVTSTSTFSTAGTTLNLTATCGGGLNFVGGTITYSAAPGAITIEETNGTATLVFVLTLVGG